MRLRPSLPFEGKCDSCGEVKTVHSVGDEDSHRIVTICDNCVKKYTDEEIFDKFSHIDESAFAPPDEKIKFHVEKAPKAG